MNKKIDEAALEKLIRAGYTAREAAERLGCSERQVKRLKKRLNLQPDPNIRRLRRHLQREGLVNEAAQVYRLAGVSSRLAADVLGVSHTAVAMADLTHVSGLEDVKPNDGDEWL